MDELKNNLKADNTEDYISLFDQFSTIKREFKILISTTLLLTAFGFFKAIKEKPLWQGSFQIVLSEITSNNANLNQGIIDFFSASQNVDKNLQTEIKILESPFILMPVFKNYKKIATDNQVNLKFSDFVSDINIELEEGTSVLNVFYKNKNKNLIIPVLNEISSEYQEYSKRDQKKKFENSLEYINGQIKKYLTKSKKSLKRVQAYAIKHNLTPLTGDSEIDKEIKTWENRFAPGENNLMNPTSNTPFNVEFERIRAANEIKIYEKKLDQLEKLNDTDSIFLLGKTEEFMGKSKITKKIEDLDIDIELMRSIFTENEPKLKYTLGLKKTYQNIFKNELYGYLNAKLMDAKARMNASERPQGVLVKYRELMREAERDEQFLNRLEYDKQVILLEQAIIVDPWELISNPNISENPINKSKKLILFTWSIIGLVLGSIFCLIKERTTDIIFSKDKLIRSIPYRLLAILNSDHNADWSKEINAPLGLLEINIENINLIPLGKITIDNINKINSIFKKNYKLSIVENPNEIYNKNDINILIIENKSIKNKEIDDFIQKVVNYNLNINFWILINK